MQLLDGPVDDLARRHLPAGDPPLLPRHLGDLVVLAEGAAEVAAHRGNRVGFGAGIEVIDGLLLDGVDACGDDGPVDEGVERPFPVFPNAAHAPLSRCDLAAMAAEGTPHMPPVEFFIKHRFFNHANLSNKLKRQIPLFPPFAKGDKRGIFLSLFTVHWYTNPTDALGASSRQWSTSPSRISCGCSPRRSHRCAGPGVCS